MSCDLLTSPCSQWDVIATTISSHLHLTLKSVVKISGSHLPPNISLLAISFCGRGSLLWVKGHSWDMLYHTAANFLCLATVTGKGRGMKSVEKRGPSTFFGVHRNLKSITCPKGLWLGFWRELGSIFLVAQSMSQIFWRCQKLFVTPDIWTLIQEKPNSS